MSLSWDARQPWACSEGAARSTTQLTFAASLILLAASSGAQELGQSRRISSSPKDAGVHHFATGTWTRGDELGTQTLPGVLYNNTAPSGYFGMTAAVEINWTDEGRLPSTSGHSNSKSDVFTVQGIQIAYCDSGVPGPLNLGLDFYHLYTACADPRALTAVFSTTATVPGLSGAGTSSCWIVTFDLTGTTMVFDMNGDGDSIFDGTSSLDNFGWKLHLDDGHATSLSFGPMLSYDQRGYFGCAGVEGDGTYYQAGTCTSPYAFGNFGSGLGLADQHYSYSPGFNNGCWWFGGYTSTSPASGFWLVIYGDGDGRQHSCGRPNSVGPGGVLSISGDFVASTPDEVATVVGVPDQPGIFFHAYNPISVSFGCGLLCAGGGIVRGSVVVASDNTVSYAYDASIPNRDLTGFTGLTRHFQYWYRDPMHAPICGDTPNPQPRIAELEQAAGQFRALSAVVRAS